VAGFAAGFWVLDVREDISMILYDMAEWQLFANVRNNSYDQARDLFLGNV
jgi:hypothetical protein